MYMRRLWPAVTALRTLSQTSNVVVVVVTGHTQHLMATPETKALSSRMQSLMTETMTAMRSDLSSKRAHLGGKDRRGRGRSRRVITMLCLFML